MVATVDGNGFNVWRRDIFSRLGMGRAEGKTLGERIAATEEALRELGQRHEALAVEIAAGGEQERGYATAANDFSDVARLRTKVQRLKWELVSLEAAEKPLLDELTVLRGEQRATRLAALQETQRNQIREGLGHLERALAVFARARLTFDEGAAEGLERGLVGIPAIWTADTAVRVKAEVERVPVPNPSPQAVAKGSRKAAGERRLPHEPQDHGAASLGPAPAPLPPGGFRKPFNDPATTGQKRVAIIRSGYEDSRGRQCRSGDVIALDVETAREVVRNGAGVFAEE
jgi:hypothetical protein